jgi:hypothetical protein
MAALGERPRRLGPGGLTWRAAEAIEWTATTEVRRGASTIWVLGGVAHDALIQAQVDQGEIRRRLGRVMSGLCCWSRWARILLRWSRASGWPH